MLLRLSVPAENDRGPRYAEGALAAIHEANAGREPVTLGFGKHGKTVGLFCRFPSSLRTTVEGQLAAAYPEATIERIGETAFDPPEGWHIWSADLRLTPDLFPIRRFSQFEDSLNRNTADPLTGLLTAVSPGNCDDIRPQIAMIVRPASPKRCRQGRRAIDRLNRPFFRDHRRLARLFARGVTSRWFPVRWMTRLCGFVASRGVKVSQHDPTMVSSGHSHDREDDLQAAADKVGRHLFEARIRLTVCAPPGRTDEAKAKIHEMAGAFGQFSQPRMARFRLGPIGCHWQAWRDRRSRGFLLSAEELATLWHPATETAQAEGMSRTEWRRREPPPVLPSTKREAEVAELGRIQFRRRRERFGIRLDDRRRHLALVGKTGMGKSTLLHRLIASDIQAGRGVALIDPHGDLADMVLTSVPKHRTNDVVLFDAGDRQHPVAFNPLQASTPWQRPLVASGVLSAFKKIYGDSWGPRLEHILRNSLLTLLEHKGTTLASLQRLLSDAGYRKHMTANLEDDLVRAFWQHEFGNWKPSFRAEAVAPIQNKVGQFLSNPILRAILSEPRSKLDLRTVMDEGRILIVNLSKGRIGEDASGLLGSLIISSLQLAAMGRAEIPEDDRRDFFCYVDEFQNFATESFATILSEARKYRLSLTLANQYLAQIEETTLEAVFGNVGSLLSFQVGASDAEAMAEQLGGGIEPTDLTALPKFTAYLRLLIDGMPSRPFSMETLPAGKANRGVDRSDVIRRTSRRRYGRPLQAERATPRAEVAPA